MYRFIAIIALITFTLPVFAKAPEKNWTVEMAQKEALKAIKMERNLTWAPQRDPYYKENMNAKSQSKTQVETRTLTFFSNGNYAVYEDKSIITFYFDQNGYLYAVAYDLGKDYPIKCYKFKYPGGKLSTVTVEVNDNDSYIFDQSGNHLYHWSGNKCYDARGKLFMTRNS